jgi:multiple sugar transport system permease protein
MSRKQRKIVHAIVVYALVGFLCVFAIAPMAWMLSTSLKTSAEQFLTPPRWIPQEPTLENYIRVLRPNRLSGTNFTVYFINSLFVSLATTILALIVALPAAYAFSRFEFPGKNVAYFAVLGRNMFPLIVFLIPIFTLMRVLGWINTYTGLIVAYLTFALPLAIWLLKGFFDGIPNELEKAARIDGSSRFGAFLRIIVPLTAAGMTAAGVNAFIQAWNEYGFARQLTESSNMRTIPVGLAYFFTENTADWGGLMASAFLFSVPVVLMFMIIQRFFIAALTQGAVKQ